VSGTSLADEHVACPPHDQNDQKASRQADRLRDSDLSHTMSECKRAILYVRVSTQAQVERGYSLAQQLEVLRDHTTRMGYDVLEEVSDPGRSGMSLSRPGLDRVRDLVATGSVSVVLAQDRDRLVKKSEHYYLLQYEFEKYGCRLEFLNDLGVVEELLLEYESTKTAERTQRGKRRKAREGKIAGGTKPNFGFRFNEARDGYEVDDGTMRVIRRIFHSVGVQQLPLNAVKRSLEAESILAPSGNRNWTPWVIRGFVLDDVYNPHTLEEVEGLVTPQVAATMDPNKRYGIWWFNRERWTSEQVCEVSADTYVYRRKVKTVPKPREEWIAVPVPDSGVPREVVDAARNAVHKNRWNVAEPDSSGARSWELSDGILRCGCCGRRMRTCVTRKPGRLYFYYTCSKRREGKEPCPNHRSYRAVALESAVWRIVCSQLVEEGEVHNGFDERIRRVRRAERGNPDSEVTVWLERLATTGRMRTRYQVMGARGLITLDELGARLEELEHTRKTAFRELAMARNRCEAATGLERDREALIGNYASLAPDVLVSLGAEERNQAYRMLRLEVLVGADGNLTLNSVLGTTKFTTVGRDLRPAAS